MNHYDILGLEAGASSADVKAAFRRLAKQCHPDRNPGNKTAEARFKEISVAYEALVKRAQQPSASQTRYNHHTGRHHKPKRHYTMHLTLKEAAWGHWFHCENGLYRIPAGVRNGMTVVFDNYTEVNCIVCNNDGVWWRKEDNLYRTIEVKQRDLENGLTVSLGDHPGTRHVHFRLDPKRMKDGTTVRVADQGMPVYGGGGYGNALIKLKVIPTPSLWARRHDRMSWSSGEQLQVSITIALVLVSFICAISYALAYWAVPSRPAPAAKISQAR